MTGSLKRIISAITRWRRIRLVAEVVGAVVLLSAGVSAGSVVASSTAPAATIHGCVNTRTGALSVKLRAGAKCPRRTKSLSWSSGAAFGSRTNTAVANTSSGATCTLGEALLMPGKTLGDNTIPANGQLLSINQFTELFSLYGTKYGGNGTTNFAVPNLKQAAPDGLTYAICLAGVFP